MSKQLEFLRECGVFFVLTMNGEGPSGRPFGAVMEVEGNLYISTADTKAVYKQLKEHDRMQIVALKPGTREWIRINGIATECWDVEIKEKMLVECPVLKKHYASAIEPHFNVFRIEVTGCEFH